MNELKPREETLYMDIAYRVSLMSHAQRKKVGALLIKNGRILSMGWNGTPTGDDNVCEDENGNTKPEVLHAELNALLKVAASTDSTEDATLFVTMSPCTECAKIILQSKISRVIYHEDYRIVTGCDFLRKHNVLVHKLEGYMPPVAS